MLEAINCDTLPELVESLKTKLNLTPTQEFEVTAAIKRLIHNEKSLLYARYYAYSLGSGIYNTIDPENPVLIGREDPLDPFLSAILKEKADLHEAWADLPNEQIVTWDVGTHKYE